MLMLARRTVLLPIIRSAVETNVTLVVVSITTNEVFPVSAAWRVPILAGLY